MEMILPHNFYFALTLTFLAGFATLLGGCFTFIIKRDNMKALSLGLGFSAGVMIFLSFTDLLDEAKELLASSFPTHFKWLVLIGFVSGILLAIIIDYFIPDHIEDDLFTPKPHHHNKEEKENYIEEDCGFANKKYKHSIKRAGIFTAIAISLHNFPEGMATFFVTTQNRAIGVSLALAIAIHNIPEGISVALPIYHATGKKRLAILYSFIAGISEPIGAILGLILFKIFVPEIFVGFLCAGVAGIMIYIAFDTLLPLAKEYGDWHLSITGIISGIIVIWTSLLLLS